MAKKTDNTPRSLEEILKDFSVNREEVLYDTGIQILNALLGGGVSLKGMYAFWGVGGSGKSSIVFQTIRSLCAQGFKGCIIDTEVALNDFQAASFGLTDLIDSEQLTILTAGTMADLEEIVMRLPQMGVNFAVVDSISALSPYVPDELCVKDAKPGLMALQESRLLPKMKRILYEAEIASFLVFHGSANINTGKPNPYAPESKQKGGYSTFHIPDVRIKVSAGAAIKNRLDIQVGCEVTLVAEKNKFAPPKIPLKGSLFFGKGISPRRYILDAGIEQGIITKSGNTYLFPNGAKAVGMNAVYEVNSEAVESVNALLTPLVLLPQETI